MINKNMLQPNPPIIPPSEELRAAWDDVIAPQIKSAQNNPIELDHNGGVIASKPVILTRDIPTTSDSTSNLSTASGSTSDLPTRESDPRYNAPTKQDTT